ncbi:HPr kinase/phosphorylase [Lichenihabitans psoromatis]|uniref:HPr kinase/phosphorylase n=1 Tax=Lichenihabitans psoromatis TaxID=2528642 RepID=UPI0013F153D4|nr:aldolase [Lichenihabitans psoromatis]
MTDDATLTFVHATALVVGEQGILIQGRSGAGKSSLALALLAEASHHHCFARLVGDDRIGLSQQNNRLIARPHRSIAGSIEWRGLGICAILHEPACVVSLAIELATEGLMQADRIPEATPTLCLLGVKVPLLTLRATAGSHENSSITFRYLDLWPSR